MIVDDEIFATDWISYKISEVFQNTVDVYKSCEASSAMSKLLTGVYDIAILDINMPGITGIEMLEELSEKRIETLVIFLTAHNEFEYAQKAISRQVVSYILKGDSDDQLIEAIRVAMNRIEQQAETNILLKIAQRRLKVAAPTIKREYII
jgi:two-component system response regulator YesN